VNLLLANLKTNYKFMIITRVLIVGLGSIGKKHLNIVNLLLPNAVLGIKLHEESKTTFSSNIKNFLSTNQMLEFQPNISILTNPAPFHIQTALKLAEINSHIFVEKPLSVMANQVSNLISICQIKNLIFQVGYNLRFSLSLQKFKEIVDSGQLGVLQKIECETGQYLPDWRPESDYRVGVSARKELGGGVLLELSHEIDYLRWIFGEVIWVSGELTTESDLEIDVEDTARFKMGFHDMSDLNGLVADVSLDFVRRTPSRICRVYGSIANLEWNGLTGEVSIFEHNKNAWEKIYTDPNNLNKTYELEWLSFIDSVNTGNKPFVTGEDGLRVIEIIEAIRIASDTGGKVPVVYDLSIGK